MEEIILRKSDIEKYGRKIMKKVYKFLHYEYILSFEEMKVEKDKLEKYLKFYLKMFDESEYENYLKEIEDKIENESLDIELIFKVLDKIKLDFEIDGDLYCETKAFKCIYQVFDNFYYYLKD